MKVPTLIGGILFGLSFLGEAIAIFLLDTISDYPAGLIYPQLVLPFICGIISGLAIGLAIRTDSFGWGEDDNSIYTLIGGIGFAGVIVFAVLLYLTGSPTMGIIISAGSAIIALIGLIFGLASYEGGL
ncbi:MAG: hypothetical protein ACFFC7_34845 [Candidatus Hermodarchaeota archaeon]